MAHVREYARLRRTLRPQRRTVNGGFEGLGAVGFGTYSTFNQRECPVPSVGLLPYPMDIAAGANSKAKQWCDCVFGGTTTHAECVNKERWFYPWTAFGKVERGWSWEFTDFIPTGIPGTGGTSSGGGGGGGAVPDGGYVQEDTGSNTMLVGGGLLLAAYLLFK